MHNRDISSCPTGVLNGKGLLHICSVIICKFQNVTYMGDRFTGHFTNAFTTTMSCYRSCTDVVREIVDQRKQEGYPHPDEEQLELKRMGEEAEEWIKLGDLLLNNLATVQDNKEENQPKLMIGEKAEEKKSAGGSEQGEAAGQEVPKKLPDEMSVIGVDDNIHSKSLQQAIEEVRDSEITLSDVTASVEYKLILSCISQTEPPPIASSEELGLATEDSKCYPP